MNDEQHVCLKCSKPATGRWIGHAGVLLFWHCDDRGCHEEAFLASSRDHESKGRKATSQLPLCNGCGKPTAGQWPTKPIRGEPVYPCCGETSCAIRTRDLAIELSWR